jgi:hypothetical protein
MVNASFDYELIKVGAIAGATLSDNCYSQAYERLKLFLAGLATSPNIDVIDVNWFAGSLSAGDVERFSTILRSLSADLPGKQIVITTGFSTGFRATEEQKNFYTRAFAALADYRAGAGVDAPFIGVFFHEALNGPEPSPAPPTPELPAEMTRWNWTAKADEMARAWSGQPPSEAMSWWLKKVENNMGLVGIQTDSAGNATVAAQPAQEGLEQIASAVSEASATAPTETVVTSPDPSASTTPDPNTSTGSDANSSGSSNSGDSTSSSSGSGFDSALKEKLQQGLLGLLDRVFEVIGAKLNGASSGAGGVNSGSAAPSTDGASGTATGDTSGAILISPGNFAARPKTAVRPVLPPVFTVGKLSAPSTFNKGAVTVRPIGAAGAIGTVKPSSYAGDTGAKPANSPASTTLVRPVVGAGAIKTANFPISTSGGKAGKNTETTIVSNPSGNAVARPIDKAVITVAGKSAGKTPGSASDKPAINVTTVPISKPPVKATGVKPLNFPGPTGNSTGNNANNSGAAKPDEKASSTGKSAGNKEPAKQSGKIVSARPTPTPNNTPPTAPSRAISPPIKRQ